MKKNLLLIAGVLFALILGINSVRRINSLQNTSEKVDEAEMRFETLKKENARLTQDLTYKQTDEFKEAEIRNKLGLVKEGEAIVIVPKEEKAEVVVDDTPNWEKWKILFFGNG